VADNERETHSPKNLLIDNLALNHNYQPGKTKIKTKLTSELNINASGKKEVRGLLAAELSLHNKNVLVGVIDFNPLCR
jgi:hypothetical protein